MKKAVAIGMIYLLVLGQAPLNFSYLGLGESEGRVLGELPPSLPYSPLGSPFALAAQPPLQLQTLQDLQLDNVQLTASKSTKELASTSQTVSPGAGGIVYMEGVELEVPPGAVEENTIITIRSLGGTSSLDEGMSNVTKAALGYKFEPEGLQFAKPVQLRMAFDPSIKESETALSNLYTYFYDTGSKSWERLERLGIDKEAGEIRSQTTHFTEMINATLKMPEGPNPIQYDVNSIKNLEAANPAAGVGGIEGPEGSLMGGNSFAIPLRVPAGRGGVAPQLRLRYNSEGSSSWLGRGFDIETDMVSIDTRFGLPNYNSRGDGENLDMYSLGGEELLYVGKDSYANNAWLFVPRVNKGYERIRWYRSEDNGGEDYWEVTDKGGGIKEYGKEEGWIGPDRNNRTQSYQWYLTKEQDNFGNQMIYEYEYDSENARSYLKTIRYTQYENQDKTITEGKFAIQFVREKEVREDRRIDTRGGFVSKLAYRLARIDIEYAGSIVRSYQFSYEYNMFGQSQLVRMSEHGPVGGGTGGTGGTHGTTSGTTTGSAGSDRAIGREFYRYSFDYHRVEERKNGEQVVGYEGFTMEEIPTSANRLSVVKSWGMNFGLYVGVSIAIPWAAPKDNWKKIIASFGVRGGIGFSYSNTEEATLDISGDGLTDYVYASVQGSKRISGWPMYNQEETSEQELYNTAMELMGLNSRPKALSIGTTNFAGDVFKELHQERQVFFSVGLSAAIGPVSGGVTWQWTYTDGYSGFVDVDGDGRLDFVKEGNDYWHRNVGNSYTAIGWDPEAAAVALNKPTISAEERDSFQRTYYQMLPYRVWKPYRGGTVSIEQEGRLLTAQELKSEWVDLASYKKSVREGEEVPAVGRVRLNKEAAEGKASFSVDGLGRKQELYFVSRPMKAAGEGKNAEAEEEGSEVEWNIQIEYNKIKYFEDQKDTMEIITPKHKVGYTKTVTRIVTVNGKDREETTYEWVPEIPEGLEAIYDSKGYLQQNWGELLTKEVAIQLLRYGKGIPNKIHRDIFRPMLEAASKKEEEVVSNLENGEWKEMAAPLLLPDSILLKGRYSYEAETQSYFRKEKDSKEVYEYKTSGGEIRSSDSIVGTYYYNALRSLEKEIENEASLTQAEKEAKKENLKQDLFWRTPDGRIVLIDRRSEAVKWVERQERYLAAVVPEEGQEKDKELDVLYNRAGEEEEKLLLRKKSDRYVLVREVKGVEKEDSTVGLEVEESAAERIVSMKDRGIKRRFIFTEKSDIPSSIPASIYEGIISNFILAGEVFGSFSGIGSLAIAASDWTKITAAIREEERHILEYCWELVEGDYRLRDKNLAADTDVYETNYKKGLVLLDTYTKQKDSIYNSIGGAKELLLITAEEKASIEGAGYTIHEYVEAIENEGSTYYKIKESISQEEAEELSEIARAYRRDVELFPYYTYSKEKGSWELREGLGQAAMQAVSSQMRNAGIQTDWTKEELEIEYGSGDELVVQKAVLPEGERVESFMPGVEQRRKAGQMVSKVQIPYLTQDEDTQAKTKMIIKYIPIYDSLADYSTEDLMKGEEGTRPLGGGELGWFYGIWTGYYEWNDQLFEKDPNEKKKENEASYPPYVLNMSGNKRRDGTTQIENIGEASKRERGVAETAWVSKVDSYEEPTRNEATGALEAKKYTFAGYIDKDRIVVGRNGGDSYYKIPGVVNKEEERGTKGTKSLDVYSRSRSTSFDINGGVSVGPLGANASHNTGKSWQHKAMMDINGDRFPDIVDTADSADGVDAIRAWLGGGNGFYGYNDYLLQKGSYLHLFDNVSTSIGSSAGAPLGAIVLTYNSSGETTQTTATPPTAPPSTEGGNTPDAPPAEVPPAAVPPAAVPPEVVPPSAVPPSTSGLVGSERNEQISTEKTNVVVNFSGSTGITGSMGVSKQQQGLVDFTGSGLPDHVRADGTGYSVQINTGKGFTAPVSWANAGIRQQLWADMGQFSTDNITYLGMSSSGSFGQTMGVTVGVSVVDATLSLGYSGTVNQSYMSVQDINGDGLVDEVVKQEGTDYFLVKYNRGDSFSDEQKVYAPTWESAGANVDYRVQVNKDLETLLANVPYRPEQLQEGSFAKVEISSEGNSFQKYINPLMVKDTLDYSTGTTFSINADVNIALTFLVLTLNIRPGIGSTLASTGSALKFMDIDGDGLPDHVLKLPGSREMYVRRNRMGKVGLLKTVHVPQGGRYKFDYEQVGNTEDMPQKRWVLQSVTKEAGFSTEAITKGEAQEIPEDRGVQSYKVEYRYANGYYDRSERTFYGFGLVQTYSRDAHAKVLRVGSSVYDVSSYYKKGLLLSRTVHGRASEGEGSNKLVKYNESMYNYTLEANRGHGSGLSKRKVYYNKENELIKTNEFAIYFPSLTREISRQYQTTGKDAGILQLETRKEYSYDRYGNVTTVRDYGATTRTTQQRKDLYAAITYKDPDVIKNILSLPSSIEVREENSSGALLRKRQGEYGSNGELVKLLQYENSTTAREYSFTYDNYGNLLTITDPRGHSISYTYDTIVQSFVTEIVNTNIKIANSPRYTSSMTWDFAQQVKLSQSDQNGQTMSFVYDEFGRLTAVRSPYDTGITPSVEYEYNRVRYPWSVTTKNKILYDADNSDTLSTVVAIDGVGRVLQTAKTGEKRNNASEAAQVGWNLSGAVAYDEQGRTVAEGQMSFVEKLFNDDNTMVLTALLRPTTKTYDAIDRVISQTLPDGASIKSEYGISNDNTRMVQKTTDPLGNSEVRELDDSGNIVRVRRLDKDNKEVTSTSYEYDPMGQMLRTLDHNKNTIEVVYDLLGRRLQQTSADTGTQVYGYDEAGNVITKDTSQLRKEGRRIFYEYDGLNRLTRINYPYSDDVLYTYGSEADNTKDNYAAGRLLNRKDNSGTVSYTYGRLGEMTSQTKTIKRLTPNRDPETATLQYKSDYLGRMQQITYPDNEVLTYTYDAGGQIKKVTGVRSDFEFPYIKDIGYDEYSQRSFIEYGNGIKTEYAYDPNRRWLSSIKTTTSTGTDYQNMTYSFDLVGNITNYTNNTDGIKTSQSYTYDSQYQLVEAEGLSKSGVYDGLPNYNVSSYSQKFTFDSIGNITNKLSTSRTDGANRNLNLNYKKEYKYYAGKAHQAESVGNFYYRYDLNGNMIEERDGGHAPEPTRKEPVLRILEEREDATIYGLNEGFAIEQNSVKPVDKSYNRKYKWDEENRLITTMDSNITVQYKYDADGERTIKYSSRGESIYFDSLWQMHTSQSLLLQSKHIYVGQSRVSTKLSIKGESSLGYEKINNYYYHPDHLGSSQLITDYRGWKYEHLEYTPYGELWVNRKAEKLNKTPFTFTGKEMDAETGLYYYGARYMNPQNSLWISADPALIDGSYFAGGNGGVYNLMNLIGYSYAGNNPIKYIDPDGKFPVDAVADLIKQANSGDAKAGNIAAGFLGDAGKHLRSYYYPVSSSNPPQSQNVDKSGLTLTVKRNSVAGDMNDTAELTNGNITIESFSGVQSEKNYKSGKQTEAQKAEADYSDPTFPNATLPVGEYKATLRSPTASKYSKALSITSPTAQLPGFSRTGVKTSDGFLIHSWSDKNKKRVRAYSFGCQIFSDADKKRLDTALEKNGIKVGDSINLVIKGE